MDKGFDHFAVALSIGVQKMVRSDRACSGVMFSVDTETGFRDVCLVTASWGLGENIVQGTVNPDEFIVFKPTLKLGFKPIVSKKLGSKDQKMVYSKEGTIPTKNVRTAMEDRQRFCISDENVLQLARWCCTIEDHYSAKYGKFMPMDMEWAMDGIEQRLYIVQARPETVHSQRDFNKIKRFHVHAAKNSRILVQGNSVGQMIGAGAVRVIKDISGLNTFKVLLASFSIYCTYCCPTLERRGASHYYDRPRLGAHPKEGCCCGYEPRWSYLPCRHYMS